MSQYRTLKYCARYHAHLDLTLDEDRHVGPEGNWCDYAYEFHNRTDMLKAIKKHSKKYNYKVDEYIINSWGWYEYE